MIPFPDLPIALLLWAASVTVFAGFTKGITGFALPLIMVSGMSTFIDPRLAIASVVIPTFVANAWQGLQQGTTAAWEAVVKFRVLLVTTLSMIYISAQLIEGLAFQSLFLLLGSVIFVVSVVQLMGLNLKLAPKQRTVGAIVAGCIAGFFGAIAGTWGPPTIIYLLAIGTEKTEQVRIAGISFGLGALVFWVAHQHSGLITPPALVFSVALLLPMFIGLNLGRRLQHRINQAVFRKITLWVLLLAALNIMRKALMS
jgi:uncharacterized protein